jgi:putative DNA primase/helicase
MARPSELLEAAEQYAAMGYAVLPCQAGNKRPLTRHGVHDASTDLGVVRGWWQRWPAANAGLAARGALVLDLDPGRPAGWPGPERAAAVRALAPPLARTPRGGYHIWFRRPANVCWTISAGKLAAGVDVRTDGGYVVVPPSRTPCGEYRWLRPLRPLAELPLPPAWLHHALDAACRQPSHVGVVVAAALERWGEGRRNTELFRLACRLRRAGLCEGELLAALREANRTRCGPPLDEREVESIARSAGRYQSGGDAMPWALKQAWAHAIAHRRRKR